MGSSPALPTLVSASQLSASPLPNLSPRPRPPCLPSVTPTTSTPPRRLSTSVKAVSKPLVSSLLSSPTLSPTSRLLATTTHLLLPGLILIPDSSAISTASSNLLPKTFFAGVGERVERDSDNKDNRPYRPASIMSSKSLKAVEAAISSVPKGERSKALQQYLK